MANTKPIGPAFSLVYVYRKNKSWIWNGYARIAKDKESVEKVIRVYKIITNYISTTKLWDDK